MTGIPDDVLERAVDAAARARSDQWSKETVRNGRGWTWDELVTEDQAKCIEWVEPIVTAALAEIAHAERCSHQRCPGGGLCCCQSEPTEVEALWATVARVEALADEWSDPGEPIGIIGLPWAMTIRKALRGDES